MRPVYEMLLNQTVKTLYFPLHDIFPCFKAMSNPSLFPKCFFCLLLGAGFIAVPNAVADESDYIYGKGVHAFFDQNYVKAIMILSQADEIESSDPRAYYFLGLAFLRQNKTEDAEHYFRKAAQLEFGGRSLRDYDVSESLRRIQGAERLLLEKIRTAERIKAQNREHQRQEARYGKENTAGREALRQSAPKISQDDLTMLQKMADDLGSNAFGLKPINPNATVTENVAVRKQETALFGEAKEIVNEQPEKPEVRRQSTPRMRVPAAEKSERTFVNPDVSVVKVQGTDNTKSSDTNTIQSMQTEIARGLGKGLGTLFSKKPNAGK